MKNSTKKVKQNKLIENDTLYQNYDDLCLNTTKLSDFQIKLNDTANTFQIPQSKSHTTNSNKRRYSNDQINSNSSKQPTNKETIRSRQSSNFKNNDTCSFGTLSMTFSNLDNYYYAPYEYIHSQYDIKHNNSTVTSRSHSFNPKYLNKDFMIGSKTNLDTNTLQLVNTYEDYIKQLEQKIQDYNYDLQMMDDKLSTTQEHLDHLKENMEEEVLRKVEFVNQQFKEEVDTLQVKLKKEQLAKKYLKEQNDQIQFEISEIILRKSELADKVTKLQQSTKEYKNLISSKDYEIKKLSIRLKEVKDESDSNSKTTCTSINSNFNYYFESPETKRKSNIIDKKFIVEEKLQYNEIKNRYNVVDKEINTISYKIEDNEYDELLRLRKNSKFLTDLMEKSENTINMKNELNNNLISENDKLKHDILRLTDEISSVKSKNYYILKINERMKNQIEEKHSMDDVYVKMIDNYEDRTGSQGINQYKMSTQLEQALKDNYENSKQYEKSLSYKDITISELNNKIKTKDLKISELELQTNILNEKINSMDFKMDEFFTELKTAMNEKSRIDTQLNHSLQEKELMKYYSSKSYCDMESEIFISKLRRKSNRDSNLTKSNIIDFENEDVQFRNNNIKRIEDLSSLSDWNSRCCSPFSITPRGNTPIKGRSRMASRDFSKDGDKEKDSPNFNSKHLEFNKELTKSAIEFNSNERISINSLSKDRDKHNGLNYRKRDKSEGIGIGKPSFKYSSNPREVYKYWYNTSTSK